jgi:hypothetical protein
MSDHLFNVVSTRPLIVRVKGFELLWQSTDYDSAAVAERLTKCISK